MLNIKDWHKITKGGSSLCFEKLENCKLKGIASKNFKNLKNFKKKLMLMTNFVLIITMI